LGKLKKMCKTDEKDYKKNKEEIVQEVKQPDYLCKKCQRVAKSKDLLCKAEKI